ncbi:MAG TPA: alpha/beta fold hydrolase [Pyrinomonadaceae bacterium]|nr:alpha/beta fold hydrolase [Pyrinomonadaceae bacterium]
MPRTVRVTPSFRSPIDSPARVRLFCFPYAGGGAAIFRAWSRELESDIEIIPALLPGRESRLREPAHTRLDPIIDALASDIIPYLDKPFAFFGHSMGALISFELARRLRQEHGIEPDHLFISGRRAPQLPEKDPHVHELPEPDFVAEVERLNGTPREVLAHAELRALLVPALRADFGVCQTYTYLDDAPLSCSLTVLGGLNDETVSREKLEAWCTQTTGVCRLQMFPGDHFFINTEQFAILQLIRKELANHR